MDVAAFSSSDSAQLIRALAPARVEAIYVHVPFCARKCHYCDFYSVVADKQAHVRFVHRLLEEMRALSPHAVGPIRTIYIGGGTPSILAAQLWSEILVALADSFDLPKTVEFTLEANPETISAELVETLAAGGVNRLSLGAQSFQPRLLRKLGRAHAPESVGRAVRLARAAGISNLSLDLIFAIPDETLAEWRADLEAALALAPEHLSCYALSYEVGTPLWRVREADRVRACPEALEAAMYEDAVTRLAAGGFRHYEISNWARLQPGGDGDWRCLHNMTYWLNSNWLALGPAAAGHIGGIRWRNAPDLEQYLSSSGGAPLAEVEELDADSRLGEELMLRLRLVEGVARDWLAARLDPSRPATARRWAAIHRHIAAGLLEHTPTHLRLTRRGLLLANEVLVDLI